MIEKIAKRMVYPTPPEYGFPYSQNQAYAAGQKQPLSLPREDIFGLGGDICETCLVIKPFIFVYQKGSPNQSSQSVIYPPHPCLGSRDRMSQEEQECYLNHNQTNGYPNALLTWIRGYWSKSQTMRLISLKISDGKPQRAEVQDISHNQLSTPSHEDEAFLVRIMMKQDYPSQGTKSIILRFKESDIPDFNTVLSTGHSPLIQPLTLTSSPIIKAIAESEHLITSEESLLSFLSYTRFNTFGLCRLGDEIYLLILVPNDFASDRTYHCEMAER
jgi:hypothetical protein